MNQLRRCSPMSSHGSTRPAGSPSPAGARAVEGGEALAVGASRAGARLEHRVEALELGDSERGLDVAHAVVEAESVVVDPAHVGRAALVSLAAKPRRGLGVGDRDHAALSSRQLLVRVEGEGREVAARADQAGPRNRARRAPRTRPRAGRARLRRRPARARGRPPGSQGCRRAAGRPCRRRSRPRPRAGSRLRVTGSTSQKTGFTPS